MPTETAPPGDFHRFFEREPVDEARRDWRYIVSDCEIGHGGRGFSRRCLHARDGRLLATMVQEALIPAPPG